MVCCGGKLREFRTELGCDRFESCRDLRRKLCVRERRAGADEEAEAEERAGDAAHATSVSDVGLNAWREVAGHRLGSCVGPLILETLRELRAPLGFVLCAYSEMVLQGLQVDEPDAAGEAARFDEALAAPAREVVGGHADEHRRLFGGNEARAFDGDFVDHCGRAQRLGLEPWGYDSALERLTDRARG